MTLKEILPELKKFKSVLVTGPQRSGTAIATKMIAEELGYREIEEEEFGIHDMGRARAFLRQGAVVVHAPGLSYIAHVMAEQTDVVVVFMRRDIVEIWGSEERIKWRTAYGGANLKAEQDKYSKYYGIYGDNIALIKYYCWDTLQKQNCVSFDLDYQSLREHPLWRDERTDFAPRQTQ